MKAIYDLLKAKKKGVLCFAVIFVLIVPACINILFKIYSSFAIFQAEWGAGDALSFYGSLLGACITICGVFITIQYTQENYKDDVRNRVLPFIAINPLRTKFQSKNLGMETQEDTSEADNYYFEYRLEKVFFVIENRKPIPQNRLTDAQNEVLKNGGAKWVRENPHRSSLVAVDLINLPCELHNVGNGTAINLRIGLNLKGEQSKYIAPMPLLPNQSFLVHIYAEDNNGENLGDYLLSFYYEDILSNKYRQIFPVTIGRGLEENPHRIYSLVDFNCTQELLTEDEYNGQA